jgi:acyl-CoA reductase-like NAD-dependent aldehyde dehydrogenase
METPKLLMDGKLVDGDQTMQVINPATEEVLSDCPRASVDQLNKAVAAAKAAFPTSANAASSSARSPT